MLDDDGDRSKDDARLLEASTWLFLVAKLGPLIHHHLQPSLILLPMGRTPKVSVYSYAKKAKQQIYSTCLFSHIGCRLVALSMKAMVTFVLEVMSDHSHRQHLIAGQQHSQLLSAEFHNAADPV